MTPHPQLFVHVLGAMALFGAVAAVAVFGLAGRRRPGEAALPRAALFTTLFVAVPAWALTLVFGSWTKSREKLPGGVDWIAIGSGIAVAGIVVILAAAAVSYAWLRRPAGTWQPAVLGAVMSGYVVALGVAWWVMSAKVPS